MRLNIPSWNGGAEVVRVGESADGAWTFLKRNVPVAWAQKSSCGKWMYFRNGNVRFFKSITELVDVADRELQEDRDEEEN